jgi:hypothetical protein
MPVFAASRDVIAETLRRWSLRSCSSPRDLKCARKELAAGIRMSKSFCIEHTINQFSGALSWNFA